MSAGYFPKREKVGLEDLFKGLVRTSLVRSRRVDMATSYTTPLS